MKFNKDCKIEKVVSRDTCRPALENVFLDTRETAKPVLVATNGRSMAVIPAVVEEHDTPGYVSPDAIKAYRKESKRQLVSLELNGSQKVGGLSMERPTEETQGAFPNWRLVADPRLDKEPAITIALNAELLADLQEALGSESVTLKIYGPLEAVRVETQNGYGLLMPMRV